MRSVGGDVGGKGARIGVMQAVPEVTLNDGAIQVHEMFMSYVNAGFSRPEALHIVVALMVNAGKMAS
jgi:hypothetical protein